MSTVERSASASDTLSRLCAKRDAYHQKRFLWVKTRRQLQALKSLLAESGDLTDPIALDLENLDMRCRDGRENCWAEIRRLDNEIDRLNAQLNNGVFDV